MKIEPSDLSKILTNADDEQLILVVKTAAEPNVDILDNESDTIEDDEPVINNNPDDGRFSLLIGNIVKNQSDYVKDLLTLGQWKTLFEDLTDESLIETLRTFTN
jgi:hypothetical protein